MNIGRQSREGVPRGGTSEIGGIWERTKSKT